MIRKLALLAAVPLVLSACATNNQGVRGAAAGAGAGAVAGAIIGNNVGDGDAGRGALIGAGIGAAAGALIGCRQPGGCGHNPNNPNHSQLYYDQYSGRYWYEDYRNGSTWWQNGEPRTAPRTRY
ncbi:MAG: YMGG-like glycine zipper-containing protein [Oceanicaulis sp.]